MKIKCIKPIIGTYLILIVNFCMAQESSHVSVNSNTPTKEVNQFISNHTSVLEQTLSSFSNRGTPSIVTVGSDALCTYPNGSIQDAINDGHNHIRVTVGNYLENPYFTGFNITLEGGYNNCSDAAADITGNGVTVIDGSNDPEVSVITIDNSAMSSQITLRRLTIRNGGSSALLYGGGISIIDSSADILLDTLDINNNSGNFGGGIGISNGSPTVIIKDTNLQFNTAQSGGGISCSSSEEANVSFYDTGSRFLGSIIGNNATTRNGGGIELRLGCKLFLFSGQNPNENADIRGILLNNAKENGGGVDVSGGSTFTAIGYASGFGNNTSPATIRGNKADNDSNNSGNGGGISVRGVDSQAFLVNVNVQDNTAYNGAAISAESGGNVITFSQYEQGTCWSIGSCNKFVSNTSENNGGVFYTSQDIDLGTTIKAYTSHIYDNSANRGAISDISGTNSLFQLEGSVAYNNNASVILYNSEETTAYYYYNTIADNSASNAIIRNFKGTIELLSSIVHNNDDTDVYRTVSPSLGFFNCLITHEDDSFDSSVLTQVADPEFIDRNNGDYHIDALLSPAVDFCSTKEVIPETVDIDNQQRGLDDPNRDDLFGPYDLGADETHESDVIFSSGFD